MDTEAKKALTRVANTVPVPARGDMLQSLETAFLAFLQSKSAPQTALVPVDRRVFLTIAESAEFTGLPLSFLRRLIADGDLKAFKAGKGWRIPRSELEALPEKLTQLAAPKDEMSDAEERDLALNKLRRQGLLPPAENPPEIQ